MTADKKEAIRQMPAGKQKPEPAIGFNASTDLLASVLGRSPHTILPYVAGAFALGITWGREPVPWEIGLWIIVLAMAGGVVVSSLLRLRGAAFIFLLLFFFAAGAIHVRPSVLPPQSPFHIYNLIPHRQPGTLLGTLVQMPQIIDADPSRPRTRLLLEAEALLRPLADPPTTGASANPAAGLVQLTMNGLPPPEIKPGDKLLIRAELSRPEGPTVPGAFNYQQYLACQNIRVTGWVESPVLVMKVQSLMPGTAWGLSPTLHYLPEQIRYQLAAFLDHRLEPRAAGLYKAILIGDTSNLDPRIFEDFRTSGCVHILSISGSHLGLLALLLISGFIWLLKRSTWLLLHLPIRKTAIGASLLPLTGYALIAGFSTPVVRSLIMTAALMAALLADRQKSVINNIAIAALIILIWQPASLFTISCQLSFAAVIGIALVSPIISRLLRTESVNDVTARLDQAPDNKEDIIDPAPQNQGRLGLQWLLAAAGWLQPALCRVGNWARAGLLVSLAASVATAPLGVFHFNMVSLIGPIANLFIEPLICLWALVVGLVACCFLPFAPEFSALLFQVGGLGLHLSETLASWFAALPMAALWLPTPSIYELIACYVLMLALLDLLRGQPSTGHIWRISQIAAAVISAAALVIIPTYYYLTRNTRADTNVTVLDVGQGSAVLAELPRGRAVLIDGGGTATERFNVGERLIAPYLWKLGYWRIDAMAITHPHADHFNGLFFVLKRFRPKQMWVNGMKSDEPAYGQLLELADKLGVEVKTGQPGSMLCESGAAALTCLANPLGRAGPELAAEPETRNQQINDSSLVLRLEQRGNSPDKGVSFLFPGDIGTEAEAAVIAAAGDALDVDVLLSPHHGSRTSNSREFLEATSPAFLVISASRGFGASSSQPEFLEQLCRRQGIELLTTARDGTICFTTDGRSLKVGKEAGGF